MKKILLISLTTFCMYYAEAQTKNYLREKSIPILSELGIDSTQFRIFTTEGHNKKALFVETDNVKFIIDTLAKKLYFGIIADSVNNYINLCIIQYRQNQTPMTVTYNMNNRLFTKP